MQSFLRRVTVGLLLATALTTTTWAQSRIATVDLRKVLDNYWKTKEAEASIKDRQAGMQKDLKEMEEDARKSKDEYQTLLVTAADQAVSAEERERRKKAAEEKLKALRDAQENMAQYDRQARVTLEEQYKRMRDNLLTEIRNVVTAKAKQTGFALVLDSSGMSVNNVPAPVVLYTNNENDMTDDILKQLNATAPADAAAAEEKKDEKKASKKKDEKK
jgi:outer membrane protein